MITNLVALLIVTNLARPHCDICDTTNGWKYAVYHEHKYEQVVTTNYLPVVVDPRKGGATWAGETTEMKGGEK